MTLGQSSSRLGNRRTHRRATLSAPVMIDSANAYHTGRCRDVSPDGLGLQLGAGLLPGSDVDLYFELPTGVALELRAQVVRAEGESVGVRFKNLRAEDRRALADYCEAWRGELLQQCARRAESMSDIRLDEVTLPYDSSEAESGVRIRVARPLIGQR